MGYSKGYNKGFKDGLNGDKLNPKKAWGGLGKLFLAAVTGSDYTEFKKGYHEGYRIACSRRKKT